MRIDVDALSWLVAVGLIAGACGSDSPSYPGGSGGSAAGRDGGGSGAMGGNSGQAGAGWNVTGGSGGGVTGGSGGSAAGSGGGAVDGGAACPDECSGHGSCEGSACACDEGYEGLACEDCADGFHLAGDACIGDACDSSSVCTPGVSACEDGMQLVCTVTAGGCPEETALLCENGGCLCTTQDEDVSVQQWNRNSGGKGLAVALRDGVVLTAGTFAGTLPDQMRAGRRDLFVRAQDVDVGVTEAWSIQWGSAQDDAVRALVVGANGELYAAGEISGSYEGSIHEGAEDGSLTKWNADRTLAWHDQWGTSDTDAVYGVAVAASGEIYIAGLTRGDLEQASGGEEDAVLRKLDANGDEIWTLQWGGSARDFATSVVIDGESEVWVAGTVDDDAFCMKVDGDGREIWTATWSSAATEAVWGLVRLSDDSVMVAGQTGGSLGGMGGAFVSRVDADGDIIWTEQFGLATSDYARGIALGADGDVYIVGEVNGELVEGQHAGGDDIFVQRRTPNGEVVWTKQVGTSAGERGHAIAVAPDGTVYATGFTQGPYPGFQAGAEDIVLIRITQ